MKKIFVFGSILVLALLLTSCVLFQKPLVLNYTGPADELALNFPQNVKLEWESSIEKFEGEIKHDVLFGTDEENLEKIAEDITAKEYVIEQGNFEFGQTFYWQVIAKAEKRDPEIGEVRSITVDEVAPLSVTEGRGGPSLTDYSYVMEDEDLIVTKEGYTFARIQSYNKEYSYEVPLRKTNANPDWDNPPKLIFTGLTAGETYTGNLDFDIEVDVGNDDALVYYVYLGGEQRYPYWDFGVDTPTGEISIDTTSFPAEETYIRVLAYTTSENCVLTIIPIVINNEATHTELPGEIPSVNAIAYTLSENAFMYGDIITPEGDTIRSEDLPADITLYNRITWTDAPNASGYRVYRSFNDEENYRLIGLVDSLKRYDDYSPELEVGKVTYYKIVPYNSYGENTEAAVVRKVISVPGPEVVLLTPDNNAKNVALDTKYTWEINYKDGEKFADFVEIKGEVEEGDYEIIDTRFIFWIWDLTTTNIYFNSAARNVPYAEGIFEYTLRAPVLKPGMIYSWDVRDAEITYLFEDHGEAGTSTAVSISGTSATAGWSYREGSVNGEFVYTTAGSSEVAPLLPEFALYDFEGLEYADDVVMVKYFDIETFGRTVRNYNSKILDTWTQINWALVEVPENETVETFIAKIITEKTVAMAQPNLIEEAPVIEYVDPYLVEELGHEVGDEVDMYKLWGLKSIRAEEAWEITTGSEDVVLAIIDSGVDINNPEFASNTMIPGYDASGDEDEDKDFNGHGTHVAGTAGAYGRDGKIAGVAWDSPILPIKVMNSDTGSIANSYLVDGTIFAGDYAEAHEVRVVINMSIGGRGYSVPLQDAIDYAVSKGVVFVTSAGNDKKRYPSFPTAYSGVIAVAASTPLSIEDGRKANFSTIGPWTSVAAPGVSIYSTLPTDQGSYGWKQGTSMASPHVAGAAALLLSKYPELTPMEVRNQLEETANDGGRGYTEELGYGVIDLVEMLGEIKPNKYGALRFETNLHEESIAGIVMVHNAEDKLVGWGSTGTQGYRMFHDLLAGEHTITLTYHHPVFGYYTHTDTVTIVAEDTQTVKVDFHVQEIEETLVFEQNIDEEVDNTAIPITIVTNGIYKFETLEYTDPNGDTKLTIFKIVDGNPVQVAHNVDKSATDYFSLIITELEPADYVVFIESYTADYPLNCKLEISVITPK